MIDLQAWPQPQDCAGAHRTRRKSAALVLVYTLVVLLVLAERGVAQSGLQGRYSGNGLEVTFRKDQAEVFFAEPLCIGHFEGRVLISTET
jgi:hypothetical protein